MILFQFVISPKHAVERLIMKENKNIDNAPTMQTLFMRLLFKAVYLVTFDLQLTISQICSVFTQVIFQSHYSYSPGFI